MRHCEFISDQVVIDTGPAGPRWGMVMEDLLRHDGAVPDVSELRPGDPTEIAGYQIVSRLGAGGQGVVYLAIEPSGERVAVKMLSTGPDGRGREQFAKEAAAVRRVAPFCTARVLAADLDSDAPYIVSEYIDGPSLQQRIDRQGPMTGVLLQRTAIGTVTALAAIHQAGVVHRDFKPANVMLAPDGPRVIDFGIARDLSNDTTQTSRIFGTPAYMAPEQLRAERVGPATDMFAWASVIAYAATGRAPFEAPHMMAVIHRITAGEPDLTGVPADLVGVLRHCLDRDPARRPTAQHALALLLGRPAPARDATDPTPVLAEATGLVRSELGWTEPERPLLATTPDIPGERASAGTAPVHPLPETQPAPDGTQAEGDKETEPVRAPATVALQGPSHPAAVGADAPPAVVAVMGDAPTAPTQRPVAGRGNRPGGAILVGLLALVIAISGGTWAVAHAGFWGDPGSDAAGARPDVTRPAATQSSAQPAPSTQAAPSGQAPTGAGDSVGSGSSSGSRGGSGGPSQSADPTIPTVFDGSWRGTVRQPTGRVTRWPARLELDEGKSNGNLLLGGRLDCSGPVFVTSASSRTLKLESVIRKDPKRICALSGSITLRLISNRRVSFVWIDARYKHNQATGELTKR